MGRDRLQQLPIVVAARGIDLKGPVRSMGEALAKANEGGGDSTSIEVRLDRGASAESITDNQPPDKVRTRFAMSGRHARSFPGGGVKPAVDAGRIRVAMVGLLASLCLRLPLEPVILTVEWIRRQRDLPLPHCLGK